MATKAVKQPYQRPARVYQARPQVATAPKPPADRTYRVPVSVPQNNLSPAATIIMIAGGITFANEWYQTKEFNWRVPVATILLAAVFEGLARLDTKVATGLSVMALLAALTTEFNGKSALDTISGIFPAGGTKPATMTAKPKQPTTKAV